MLYEIYIITNLLNGKIYIGQTQQGYKKRFIQHIYEANYLKDKRYKSLLRQALRKYGASNFKIELLDNTAKSSVELDELEALYIQAYNSLVPSGYNLTDKILIQNRKKARKALLLANKKTSYRGVQYLSRGNKWKTKYSNRVFKTDLDAAIAYDVESLKCLGDKAILNFPQDKNKYLSGEIIPNYFRNKTRSKYKGVTWHNNKWLAQFCINRKAKCIGYFKDEMSAAQAYDKKVKELGLAPNFP